ncbi:hypothetical protein LF817_00915 [Halobacillus sp. A1]|uniref:hypothetical protein n=1 Tax=Halobacillus sp. A1 TaxID=2880262 RepID=UPI0020A6926F|nr:hypothetical protein [Halobacillus sp. A1]MCP3029892.1 hypothetical protein [Halobacillus sp. A1]
MAFTFGKMELIHDLQQVFAKHNVQAIKVNQLGTLFLVEPDGSLKIGAGATITSFEFQPNERKASRFKLIDGGSNKDSK